MASIDHFAPVPRPPLSRPTDPRLTVLARLRVLFSLAQDPLAVALAVGAGLALAAWLLGLGAPAPQDPLLIL